MAGVVGTTRHLLSSKLAIEPNGKLHRIDVAIHHKVVTHFLSQSRGSCPLKIKKNRRFPLGRCAGWSLRDFS